MSLVDKVKHDLLSVSAVIVTVLHLFMIVGGLTCWVALKSDNPFKILANM
jgi:hypothetical protein